jgi:hypothetical protein
MGKSYQEWGEKYAAQFTARLSCCPCCARFVTVKSMDGASLAMAQSARRMCSSGDLARWCAREGIRGSWLASAVAQESGLSVDQSTARKWMKGAALPDGERAVGLFKVLTAMTGGS